MLPYRPLRQTLANKGRENQWSALHATEAGRLALSTGRNGAWRPVRAATAERPPSVQL